MNTSIFIDGMRLHAYHGVLEQEHRVGNDYVIDLRVDYPFEHAIDTDDLADTISYADLADIIRQEMAIASKLVEHVAGRIVRRIADSYPSASYIYIKVKKVAPPMKADCDGAGVVVELNLVERS